MADVNDLVDEMTSQDFNPTNIIGKIQVAYLYCSSIFGSSIPLTSGTVGTNAIDVTDDDHSMAIALLAEAMLIEGRKVVQARTNPSIRIRSTKELFTDEMRNMLLIADATEDEEISEGVMWNDDLPTERWDVS